MSYIGENAAPGVLFWNGTRWVPTGLHYQTVQNAGSAVTKRSALNFIAGTGISLGIADDSGNDRTNVTINSSGGGLKYTVGTSTVGANYTTIQAAINAAVADGASYNSPAEINIQPGYYLENITLSGGGIALRGIGNEWGVYVDGTMTVTNDPTDNAWVFDSISVNGLVQFNGAVSGNYAIEMTNCKFFRRMVFADATNLVFRDFGSIFRDNGTVVDNVIAFTTGLPLSFVLQSSELQSDVSHACFTGPVFARNSEFVGRVVLTGATSGIYQSDVYANTIPIDDQTTSVCELYDIAIHTNTASTPSFRKTGPGLTNYGGLTFNDLAIAPFVQISAGTTRQGYSQMRGFANAGVSWSLPLADGALGNVLQTDGAGALSWLSLSGFYARNGSTGAMLANVDFDTYAAVWENEPIIAPFNGGFGTYTLPGLGPQDTGALLMGGAGSTSEFNSEARWYTEVAGSKILLLNPGNATSGNVVIFSGSEKARFGFNNSTNRVEIAATGSAPLYIKNNGVSWAWPTADGSSGQVLQTNGSGVTSWVTISTVSPGGAPVNVTKATASAGVAATYSRSDHKHDITTASAVTLSVGGASSEGTATSLARSDHTHALPAFGTAAGTFCEGNDSRLSNDRTASGIRTATTIVAVSTATAPTPGQVLQATSSTAAQWSNVTATAGGSTTQVQFNNLGALDGDAQFTWDPTNNILTVDTGSIFLSSSVLQVGAQASPATPAANRVSLYQESQAARAKLARIDEYGLKQFIQDSMERQSYAFWKPPGNSTTVPGVFGFAAMTATGTATARNVATTNYFTRLKRLAYVSSATAGSLAGARLAVAQYTIGAGGSPPVGGFYLTIVFGCSDAATVAGARQFVGASSSTGAPTNVEPSTLTNCIGVGHGAADTNLKIFYGGSAAQTPIDLGANFPANTLSVDAYELVLWCPPTAQQVNYKVTRLNTGDSASGTLAGVVGTAFPAATTLLTPVQAWRSNNATALAVGLDIMSIYLYGNN